MIGPDEPAVAVLKRAVDLVNQELYCELRQAPFHHTQIRQWRITVWINHPTRKSLVGCVVKLPEGFVTEDNVPDLARQIKAAIEQERDLWHRTAR